MALTLLAFLVATCFVGGGIAAFVLFKQNAAPNHNAQSSQRIAEESQRAQELFSDAADALGRQRADLMRCEEDLETNPEGNAAEVRQTLQNLTQAQATQSLRKTTTELDATLRDYGDVASDVINGLFDYVRSITRVGQVFRRAEETDDAQTELLEMIRNIKLENCRLQAEAKRKETEIASLLGQVQKAKVDARVDSLTRLPNRRAWEEFAGATAGTRPDSYIALVDIDQFKVINDDQGHGAGDAVLQFLAKVLRETPGVHAYRSGGDEFTLLLDANSQTAAVGRLDAVREKLAAATIHHKDTRIKTTISIGVAAANDAKCLRDVADRADTALYAAKNSGRNCIQVYQADAKTTVNVSS